VGRLRGDEQRQTGENLLALSASYCGGPTTSFGAELPANLPQLCKVLPERLRRPSEEPVNSGYVARAENGGQVSSVRRASW